MDSQGERRAIIITSANDNSRVRSALPMESLEMSSIERQDCSTIRNCESEYFGIIDFLIGLAGIPSGKNIMSQNAKLMGDFMVEVFIRVKTSHYFYSSSSYMASSLSRISSSISLRF